MLWLCTAGRSLQEACRSAIIGYFKPTGSFTQIYSSVCHVQELEELQIGQLLTVRISEVKPFYSSGVNYAGLICVWDRTGRGVKCYKAYICLFVCIATKAIHLELIIDLSAVDLSRSYDALLEPEINANGCTVIMELTLEEPTANWRQCTRQPQNFIRTAWMKLSKKRWKSYSFSYLHPLHILVDCERLVLSSSNTTRMIGDQMLTREDLCTLLIDMAACLNSRSRNKRWCSGFDARAFFESLQYRSRGNWRNRQATMLNTWS